MYILGRLFFNKILESEQNLLGCVYWGPNNNQIKYLENPPATNIFLLTFCFKYIYIYQGFFYKKLQRGQNLLEYVHWHPNDNQIKNLKNPPATNILFLMFSIYMYRRRNKIINFSYVISTPQNIWTEMH